MPCTLASGLRRLLLIVGIALALSGLSADALAAARYEVKPGKPFVSVRNRPSAFVLGHLLAPTLGPGQHFDLTRRSRRFRGWAYGRVGGGYGSWAGAPCGWVLLSGVKRTSQKTDATCPNPRSLEDGRIFTRGSYALGCGQGCVYPAVVTPCPDRRVYINYDPASGRLRDPVGASPVGRGTFPDDRRDRLPRYPQVSSGYSGFGMRYLTKDGRAVLVKDTEFARATGLRFRVPVWLFMDARCVSRLTLVLRADSSSVSLGTFRFTGFQNNRVGNAVGALGPTSSRPRRSGRVNCRARWAHLALTARFLALGLEANRPCSRGQFSEAKIGRVPRRGNSMIHIWATDRGLRVGASTRTLRRLYPGARRRRGTYSLGSLNGFALRAQTSRGRVRSFTLTPTRRAIA